MRTKLETIRQFLHEASNCAMQMMENGNYIQKQLPSLTMADALREKLNAICMDLIGNKHDIIHEIFEIEELLTSSHELSEIEDRIERISQWIIGEVHSFNEGVTQAQEAVKVGNADSLLQMLLMESGFNILTAIPTAPYVEEKQELELDETEENDKLDEENSESSRHTLSLRTNYDLRLCMKNHSTQ